MELSSSLITQVAPATFTRVEFALGAVKLPCAGKIGPVLASQRQSQNGKSGTRQQRSCVAHVKTSWQIL